MFTMLFMCIAAAALYSGAPWLFSFALTALLIKAFPIAVLPGISAIAIWAIKVNWRK